MLRLCLFHLRDLGRVVLVTVMGFSMAQVSSAIVAVSGASAQTALKPKKARPVLTIALPDTLVNPYDQFSLNETVDALRQKQRAYAIRTVIFSAAEVLDALCIRGWAKKMVSMG